MTGDTVKVTWSTWLEAMAPRLIGLTGIVQQELAGWVRVKIGSEKVLFKTSEIEEAKYQKTYATKELCAWYGIRAITLSRRVAKGLFPKPKTTNGRHTWTGMQIKRYDTGIDKSI